MMPIQWQWSCRFMSHSISDAEGQTEGVATTLSSEQGLKVNGCKEKFKLLVKEKKSKT
jgi:hypothetical protein